MDHPVAAKALYRLPPRPLPQLVTSCSTALSPIVVIRTDYNLNAVFSRTAMTLRGTVEGAT